MVDPLDSFGRAIDGVTSRSSPSGRANHSPFERLEATRRWCDLDESASAFFFLLGNTVERDAIETGRTAADVSTAGLRPRRSCASSTLSPMETQSGIGETAGATGRNRYIILVVESLCVRNCHLHPSPSRIEIICRGPIGLGSFVSGLDAARTNARSFSIRVVSEIETSVVDVIHSGSIYHPIHPQTCDIATHHEFHDL